MNNTDAQGRNDLRYHNNDVVDLSTMGTENIYNLAYLNGQGQLFWEFPPRSQILNYDVVGMSRGVNIGTIVTCSNM